LSGHALSVVEFQRVLDWIAGRAFSEPGKAAVRALQPSGDPGWIRAELGRVEDARVLLESASPWAPPVIPEVSHSLGRLPVEGGVLDPVELHFVGLLLVSARTISDVLDRHGSELPRLKPIRERLYTNLTLEQRLARSVDAQGQVLDSASHALRDLRSRLRSAQKSLVRKLEAFARTLPERIRVDDGSVTLRDGRYVVPVRREGKSEVGGVIHDESASGATIFVEPPVALGLMNELRSFEAEVAREVQRILRELTADCRPHAADLVGSYRAMIEFDSLYARARVAAEWGAHCPEISDADDAHFHIERGRHPLLLARAEVEVIPFDLSLEPGERVVVVSGPNTGGKSVFLKAVGLLTSLAQAGVVPPVGPGTKLPVFRTFYADIGDEQSIAADLSTFSAHLLNLKEIVEGADGASLVLIDEMGTGTDPTEGAALARAILEQLVSVGARGVVTSHLGALKRLDGPDSGIVNASLQFDPDLMEPTYHFVKGRPGRSFGLAIAERRGLPAEVLRAARGFIDSGEASVDDLLERLERQEKEAESLVASLDRETREAARLRAELDVREIELRSFEEDAERKARDDARSLLMDARSEVERAIEAVRLAKDREELEASSRQARSRVEQAAEHQKKLRPKREGRGSAPDGRSLAVGDRVRVAGSGAEGVIVEIRDQRAVLDASGLRLQVPAAELELLHGPAPKAKKQPSHAGWEPSTEDGLTEVDLRGLRVDEVEVQLGPALDRALVTEVPEFRIIHGMGTGAVRERVSELLARDGRVADFRLGGRGEGGGGVTVVTFK
jgi:DNA mismatch repair protein MutS2